VIRRYKGDRYMDRWRIKQLKSELRNLGREVEELRSGRDAKRWPALIRELREAERDRDAARAALRKVAAERDALLSGKGGGT
jgi:hypothetical protein